MLYLEEWGIKMTEYYKQSKILDKKNDINLDVKTIQMKSDNITNIIQKGKMRSSTLKNMDTMALQRKIGNKAVSQLFKNNEGNQKKTLQRKSNNTGLPDNLKAGVESLSGISMDDVKVHYNSDKPIQLGALAYTKGTDIHIAPGREKYLPHETWHVVQQAQGRVRATTQMKGVAMNDNMLLEKEADEMGKIISKKKSPIDYHINSQSKEISKKTKTNILQYTIVPRRVRMNARSGRHARRMWRLSKSDRNYGTIKLKRIGRKSKGAPFRIIYITTMSWKMGKKAHKFSWEDRKTKAGKFRKRGHTEAFLYNIVMHGAKYKGKKIDMGKYEVVRLFSTNSLCDGTKAKGNEDCEHAIRPKFEKLNRNMEICYNKDYQDGKKHKDEWGPTMSRRETQRDIGALKKAGSKKAGSKKELHEKSEDESEDESKKDVKAMYFLPGNVDDPNLSMDLEDLPK